jgi:hypothetical protein
MPTDCLIRLTERPTSLGIWYGLAVFPALDQANLLLYCFFWLQFLRFWPRDISSALHAFRPLLPRSSKIPI